MQTWILFVALLCSAHAQGDWEPCGQPTGCYCSRPILHHINCRNITVFPAFEEHVKPGVLTVMIYDSDIEGLPPFRKDEWDRLRDVRFLDTPRISCDAVAELRRPGLTVLSECDCPTPTEGCKEGTTCLASLVALLILIGICGGFIFYTLRLKKNLSGCRRRTNISTCET
jgi:hypothetical protein